jgi:hypothetical protein
MGSLIPYILLLSLAVGSCFGFSVTQRATPSFTFYSAGQRGGPRVRGLRDSIHRSAGECDFEHSGDGYGNGSGSSGNGGGDNGGIGRGNDCDSGGDSPDHEGETDGVVVQQGSFVFFLKALCDQYTDLLKSAPFTTKMISSGLVGGLGDFIIQSIECRSTEEKKFDRNRFFAFVLVNGLFFAPLCHIWFEFLEKLPYPAARGENFKVLAMLFVDQTVGAITLIYGFFYALEFFKAILPPYAPSDPSWLEAGHKSVKENYVATLLTCWTCWPAINFINFKFVPLELRILFMNVADIFWNAFMSRLLNRKA